MNEKYEKFCSQKKLRNNAYLKVRVFESQFQKQITPSFPEEASHLFESRHIGENYDNYVYYHCLKSKFLFK